VGPNRRFRKGGNCGEQQVAAGDLELIADLTDKAEHQAVAFAGRAILVRYCHTRCRFSSTCSLRLRPDTRPRRGPGRRTWTFGGASAPSEVMELVLDGPLARRFRPVPQRRLSGCRDQLEGVTRPRYVTGNVPWRVRRNVRGNVTFPARFLARCRRVRSVLILRGRTRSAASRAAIMASRPPPGTCENASTATSTSISVAMAHCHAFCPDAKLRRPSVGAPRQPRVAIKRGMAGQNQ
jgi:hypothetical protein